ncbi:hypothetical protein [Altererythrobacter sp.]|uniref:hypothetical protein n=1 Tax=Altererythrobacter sp. TaxID=1872480 RepID=UPI003D003943
MVKIETMKWAAKAVLAMSLATGLWAISPVSAKDDGNFDVFARVELRAVQSDLDFNEGDDVDSSGFGASGDVGAQWEPNEKTKVRVKIDASVFDYHDKSRDTRESIGGTIQLTHQVSEEIELRMRARRVENIAVLETLATADQSSADARLQWERGDDRIRLSAQYREREYDLSTPAKGHGYRLDAQYSRRLGSYHWIRLDLRHEEMDSKDSPRRSYRRSGARIKYSLPIAKRLRVRPSLEYREWKYDSRIARGDPDGSLREDSFVAPGVDIAWGRDSRGLYASASAEYRLRKSNDERYGDDAIRVGLRIGYRF